MRIHVQRQEILVVPVVVAAVELIQFRRHVDVCHWRLIIRFIIIVSNIIIIINTTAAIITTTTTTIHVTQQPCPPRKAASCNQEVLMRYVVRRHMKIKPRPHKIVDTRCIARVQSRVHVPHQHQLDIWLRKGAKTPQLSGVVFGHCVHDNHFDVREQLQGGDEPARHRSARVKPRFV